MKLLKSIYKKKIFKFAVVGALGTITNLAIFFLLVDILKFRPNVINIIVFFIAGTQNYILNHAWTFSQQTAGNKISFIGWIKFTATSAAGFAVNLIVLNLVLIFFNPPLKVIAQGIGILCGMILNFFGSKHFVFRKKAAKESD